MSKYLEPARSWSQNGSKPNSITLSGRRQVRPDNVMEFGLNATSRLARWRRQANELTMRRHFTRSTGRRRRVFLGEGALRVRTVQATGIILSWFQGINGKPTFCRLANPSWLSAICNYFVDIAAWSPKSLKIFPPKAAFLEKTPYGQIFKNVFRTESWWHRTTSYVQTLWNLVDRKFEKSCVN